MRAAQKLLGAPTIGGGEPGQGDVAEEVKEVNYTPKPPRMYENGKKKRQFPHLLTLKSPKMPFFI